MLLSRIEKWLRQETIQPTTRHRAISRGIPRIAICHGKNLYWRRDPERLKVNKGTSIPSKRIVNATFLPLYLRVNWHVTKFRTLTPCCRSHCGSTPNGPVWLVQVGIGSGKGTRYIPLTKQEQRHRNKNKKPHPHKFFKRRKTKTETNQQKTNDATTTTNNNNDNNINKAEQIEIHILHSTTSSQRKWRLQ